MQRKRKIGINVQGTAKDTGQMKWQEKKGVVEDEVRIRSWGCVWRARGAVVVCATGGQRQDGAERPVRRQLLPSPHNQLRV